MRNKALFTLNTLSFLLYIYTNRIPYVMEIHFGDFACIYSVVVTSHGHYIFSIEGFQVFSPFWKEVILLSEYTAFSCAHKFTSTKINTHYNIPETLQIIWHHYIHIIP